MSDTEDALATLRKALEAAEVALTAAEDAAEDEGNELARARDELDAWERSEQEGAADGMQGLWEAIAAIHRDAHGDRTPLRLCMEPSCRDLRRRAEDIGIVLPEPAVTV